MGLRWRWDYIRNRPWAHSGQQTDGVRQESLWTLFAGDTVICSVSREQVEVWSGKLVQSGQNPRVWVRGRHVDRWTCEERSQCRWMSLNTWAQSSIQCTRGGEEERAGREAWVETRIRNESIRWTSQSQRGWGVQRREGRYTGRRMMKIELPARRRRGRPLRIFMDVVKEGWSDRGGPYLT